MNKVNISRLFFNNRHAALFEIEQQKPVLFDVVTSSTYELTLDEAEKIKQMNNLEETLKQSFVEKHLSRLNGFISQGLLFGPDYRRQRPKYEKRLMLQDVVVQIAYTCNFACTYCYADEGEYGGGKAYTMTEQVARDLVDFSFKNRATNSLGFCLLGGEPLLNMKAVKALVSYAREKGQQEGVIVEFLLTTNGTPVSPNTMQYFKDNDVAIRLSVDGTREIHDHYRPTKKGKPTFDMVNNTFGKSMKDSGVDYSVRATLFGPYGESIQEQVRTLFEDYNYENVKVDFIWGVEGTPGLITEQNIDSVYKGIDTLGSWFKDKVMNKELNWYDLEPFSKYIGRIRKVPKVSPLFNTDDIKSNYVGGSILENNGVECGAGINVISISANGDIYSCHRTEGKKEFKMGSIYEGVSMQHLDYWGTHWRLEDENADCSKCWARYICIGGCPAFGFDKHKDPMKCDRVKCNVRRQFIANSVILNHEMKKIEKEQGISLDPPAKSCNVNKNCKNCTE
ncbi:MAG TPA: radical SAM protein [Patescibacteria group bacterium]|nr:radical SAM protein [Gammaproteobacteria bacterium]HWA51480.1 radical SAM protein [Patescibacteria group bacterium]